jgi:hypothetical protein
MSDESDKSLALLVEMMKSQTATTLAAGIIAASGRPHSIVEAMALVQDIHFATYPAPGYGAYKEWAKTKDDCLKKVHV